MSPAGVILIGVAAVAIAAALAAFAIAWRRSTGVDWRSGLSRETRRADRSRPEPITPPLEEAVEAPGAEETPPPVIPAPAPVTVATARRVVEVSAEESGVTRRQFFNRALGASFGTFMGLLGLNTLAFLWPNLRGGFGSDVNAGKLEEIRARLFAADGTVIPAFIPEARAYVVPYEQLSGQFEGSGVAADGVMALYQRCVHLGCRVPWCAPSQGFECPCHGSKYSAEGEYFAGPAPRNLDRFVIEVNAVGELIIKTGQIVQTPRAQVLAARYPQGPSCIGAVAAAGGGA